MDTDSNSPAPPQHTRRDIIKRTAAGGVAVWAAPAILSVSRAAASSPVNPPVCCACTNDATALRVLGSGALAGINTTVAGTVTCLANFNLGLLSATVLCSETGCAAAACFATASVDSVSIGGGAGPLASVLSTAEITSQAFAPCNCGAPTGTTTIAALSVLGTNVVPGIVNAGAIPANTVLANIVLNLGFGSVTASVTLNEQSCVGGQFRVRAVHIVVTETVPLINFGADIVISESIAKAAACAGC